MCRDMRGVGVCVWGAVCVRSECCVCVCVVRVVRECSLLSQAAAALDLEGETIIRRLLPGGQWDSDWREALRCSAEDEGEDDDVSSNTGVEPTAGSWWLVRFGWIEIRSTV